VDGAREQSPIKYLKLEESRKMSSGETKAAAERLGMCFHARRIITVSQAHFLEPMNGGEQDDRFDNGDRSQQDDADPENQ